MFTASTHAAVQRKLYIQVRMYIFEPAQPFVLFSMCRTSVLVRACVLFTSAHVYVPHTCNTYTGDNIHVRGCLHTLSAQGRGNHWGRQGSGPTAFLTKPLNYMINYSFINKQNGKIFYHRPD